LEDMEAKNLPNGGKLTTTILNVIKYSMRKWLNNVYLEQSSDVMNSFFVHPVDARWTSC